MSSTLRDGIQRSFFLTQYVVQKDLSFVHESVSVCMLWQRLFQMESSRQAHQGTFLQLCTARQRSLETEEAGVAAAGALAGVPAVLSQPSWSVLML